MGAVRRTQPQGLVRINWTNPLAKRLVSLVWMGDLKPRDLVNPGIVFVSAGGTYPLVPSVGKAGRGWLGDPTNDGSFGWEGPRGSFGIAKLTMGVSLIHVGGGHKVSGANRSLFGIGDGYNGGYRLGNNYGKTLGATKTNGTGTVAKEGNLFGAATVLGMTLAPALMTLYIDGKVDVTQAFTGDIIYNNTYGHIQIGGNIEGVQSTGAFHQFGAAFDGVLSAEEMRSLARNPWQLFAAEDDEDIVVSGSPDGTATPSGIPVSLSIRSATAKGDAGTSPSGIPASLVVGSVVAHGYGNATPSGIPVSIITGSPAGSGTANVSVTGIAASIAARSVSPKGDAVVAASGVAATYTVGPVSASGATVVHGTANPAGLPVSVVPHSPTGSGHANVSPSGVAATFSIGTVVASGVTVVHGTANPSGVTATFSVRSVTTSANARVNATGVSASFALRNVIASGGQNASVNVSGIPVAISLRSVSTSASANASVTGIQSALSLRSPTYSADANVGVLGILATWTIGTAVATPDTPILYPPRQYPLAGLTRVFPVNAPQTYPLDGLSQDYPLD